MNALLLTDLHLTDNPLEEYRWSIFPLVIGACLRYEVTHVYILGDLTDRNDRHKGVLVNRVLNALADLVIETGVTVNILAGNHDAPLGLEPYFWKFLDYLPRVYYITESILLRNGVWVLPFSKTPSEDWANLELYKAKAILMHQTLTGAVLNDYVIEHGDKLPIMPRGVPIYSGDVHRPQIIRGVNYIGAPYPVKFDEGWRNQLVLIEQGDWKNPKYLPIRIIRRGILDLIEVPRSWGDKFIAGDQVRIRYHLAASKMQSWPTIEQEVRDSCAAHKIQLVSIEAVIARELPDGALVQKSIEFQPPPVVIRKFGEIENLEEPMIAMGIELYGSANANR
jgi:hypothetical protein